MGKIQNIKITQLDTNNGQIEGLPKNPRFIKDNRFKQLVKSIEDAPEMLDYRTLLVFPHEKKYVIIAGNMRFRACKELGYKELPCYVLPEETPAEKLREYAIKDNIGFGADDWDILMNEWDTEELKDWGMEMPDDWKGEEEETEVVEDEIPEEVETRCKRGDVWQLGEHRLMCGDSTKSEDVEKLMNGERADIAFTSPPYGVNDGTLREHKVAGKPSHASENFYQEYDDKMTNWPQLVEQSWQRMHEYTDQQFINIQMLSDNKRELMQWVARHSDNICDILIWDKGHAAPQIQPNIVSNNFEFIFVFGADNSNRVLKYGNFHGNYEAILRIGTGQNEYADEHKAVFPIEFAAEILKINGNAKSVLELFGGTGTTMIAAEQLGRKCYTMEIDSHYCDIILARWEKLTGKNAEKIN